MYLALPSDGLASLPNLRAQMPRGITSVWPAEQPTQNIGDPRIFGTVFQDAEIFHAEIIERVCSQAYLLPGNYRGAGGKKIRDMESWSMPGFQLLMQRALLMFCRCHNVPSAHVLDRWANVMQHGDYSTPHSHYDAESALVYTVDPGETDPNDPMDGNFELIDSRIPFCCPYQPERPLRGIAPVTRAGVMLLFPAELIHHVRPYAGRRPRITVAWNISAGPPPTDRIIDPTKPVPMKTAMSE
jgi:Putative 2OG-Fe(II) oxygenase